MSDGVMLCLHPLTMILHGFAVGMEGPLVVECLNVLAAAACVLGIVDFVFQCRTEVTRLGVPAPEGITLGFVACSLYRNNVETAMQVVDSWPACEQQTSWKYFGMAASFLTEYLSNTDNLEHAWKYARMAIEIGLLPDASATEAFFAACTRAPLARQKLICRRILRAFPNQNSWL
eukprot:GHVU01206126.1.p1 GENE.GHVU01206126.1~~GHVU01206126.1.p1  ORF type:complete len:175 (-),score=8.38 GHVU01206126.1:577-1101(-)